MTEKPNTHQSATDRVVEERQGNLRFAKSDYHKPMIERFGERYLQYRREWDKSAKGEYLPPFPIQLDLEIIDYCNLQCIMCPRSINRGSGTKLPLADFKRIIDEGAEKGLKAILFGSIDEPLLNKDLFSMIGYASAKGIMDIRLNSNATLLRRELSQKLATSGLTYISFSIDAASIQTYRKIRGGDLNKIENNINTFLDILDRSRQSLPQVRVSLVAMSENQEEVDQFIRKWSPHVDFVEIQEYLQLQAPKMVNNEYELDEFSCYQPWQRLTITAHGNFAPCCTFNGLKLLMGNIYEKSVVDCWNSKQMDKLREYFLNKTPPQECISCYASRSKLYES